jgi:hypothetical protein
MRRSDYRVTLIGDLPRASRHHQKGAKCELQFVWNRYVKCVAVVNGRVSEALHPALTSADAPRRVLGRVLRVERWPASRAQRRRTEWRPGRGYRATGNLLRQYLPGPGLETVLNRSQSVLGGRPERVTL